MELRRFLIFTLTALLDVIVGTIIMEVLGMIYMKTMPIESVMTIGAVVPLISIAESVINVLKTDEELK